ncbi:MAG: hypothetical protein Q4B00_12500 [Eubacteriales bacterium]|nr:hypothetical protein [Eubacteriales bacterium]
MNVLDKEEFRIKLEEINKLVQLKDYKGAMSIVDSIDWRRVKNVRTLCVVGEIYAANKRYEDSKEIFLLAYNRASIGKNILYRLIEISLKMNDIEDAVEFFDEYKQVASNDNTQYILEYKIARAKNASLNEQIKILEEYKDREFTEKWSYELATLYYKAGDKERCLDLCNEIILWFSEGKYVTKTLDLKMRMGELTGAEREKFEQQFIPKLITPEEKKAMEEDAAKNGQEDAAEASEKPENKRIESIRLDERDLNSVESLQEKISKGIRDIFNGKKKEDDLEENQTDEAEVEKSIPEELIKTGNSVSEPENVPALEPEIPGVKPDFSNTIKMPELKIPDSMKKIDIPQAPPISAPDITQEEIAEEKKNFDFDFNLEDTILAAASVQGIEIPKEPEADETAEMMEEEAANEAEAPEEAKESVPEDLRETASAQIGLQAEKKQEIPRLEEEEFLTEEDLQSAEEEFLNGPASRRPDFNPTDSDEEDFLGNLLSEQADALAKDEPVSDEPQQAKRALTEEEELEQLIASFQTGEETDPLDIVPRERQLRDEEKKIFTYFVKVPGLEEQLIDTLCDVQLAASDTTSKTGNIIIMGGRECGKTRLISGLIPAICKELNIEASKVAYVFADQINDKDIPAIVKKLSGGFLVIENANQLNQRTVDMLDKAMEADTEGMIVIIEDEKIGMRKLIARFPKFAKKFTSMINIPVFTNDELVNFARVYTKENGYTIDQMGMLALYNLISTNQKEDEPMSVGAVKDLIDAAIMKSQGGIRKFKRNISKKRTDNDGFIVLYEKDFI